MKWIKYLCGVIVLFIGATLIIGGPITGVINVLQAQTLYDGVIAAVSALLVTLIGLYIARAGLRLFKRDKPKAQ
jgi:predicted tellurium resistance membrane protein TerC